ncbi:TPA: ATPase domain-containing protein [Legionella pneumophila]
MNIYKTKTGVKGLDDVLNGGYIKNEPTLLKGGPGTGKTIFTFFLHMNNLSQTTTSFISPVMNRQRKLLLIWMALTWKAASFCKKASF